AVFGQRLGSGGFGGQQLVAVVVEIADQRHLRPHHRQPVADAWHGRGGLGRVDGDAHQLRAGAPQLGDLLGGGRDVGGVGVGHRLHHHRRLSAHLDAANGHGAGMAAGLRPEKRSDAGAMGTGIHPRIVPPRGRRPGVTRTRHCATVARHPAPSTMSLDDPNHVLTPSQLNTLARDMLEGAFPLVWIEAELGNVARPASGHLYLTRKDARAQVRAAMFKPKSSWLKFVPREGMRVLARGRLTLYEARGEYQMVLDHMEEAGEGALRRAFEELKAKLAAEGLFDADRK